MLSSESGDESGHVPVFVDEPQSEPSQTTPTMSISEPQTTSTTTTTTETVTVTATETTSIPVQVPVPVSGSISISHPPSHPIIHSINIDSSHDPIISSQRQLLSRTSSMYVSMKNTLRDIQSVFQQDADVEKPRYVAPLPVRIFLIIVSVLIGVILVIQVGMNSRMGQTLGHGIRGAFVNFFVGTILLAICRITTMSTWLSAYWDSRKHPDFRIWMLSGGLLGAIFVALSIILVDLVGFALFFVSAVTGQILASIAMDSYGFLGYSKLPLNIWKVAGVILTLAGCVMLQNFNSTTSPGYMVLYTVLGLIGGALAPLQAAVNNIYAIIIKSPVAVCWLSFVTGTFALTIAYFITLVDEPFVFHTESNIWWQYFGGTQGLIFVLGALFIPPIVGIAPFFVCLVCGQLVFSMVSDAEGIFGDVRTPSTVNIIGIFVAFFGAFLVATQKGKTTSQQQQQEIKTDDIEKHQPQETFMDVEMHAMDVNESLEITRKTSTPTPTPTPETVSIPT